MLLDTVLCCHAGEFQIGGSNSPCRSLADSGTSAGYQNAFPPSVVSVKSVYLARL
jgi:hypothetical protein